MEDLKKNGGKKSTEGSSMLEFMKTKIKEYVDMLDASDEIFIKHIFTMMRNHLERTGRL